MIEAFPAFGHRRSFILRERRYDFCSHEACVLHNALGITRVNTLAAHFKNRSRRIEVFIRDFTFIAAIHRISELRLEILQIKEVRTTTDFFVGRKAYPDIAMRNSFPVTIAFGKEFHRRHNRRNSRLVIRAEERCAIRRDERSAF